jgi:hypothetical protein
MWWTPDLNDWRAYCAERANESCDPFLDPNENAAPTDNNTPAPSWRDLPPTGKQLEALRRFGFSSTERTDFTRGAASDELSRCIDRAQDRDNQAWEDDYPPRDWGDL